MPAPDSKRNDLTDNNQRTGEKTSLTRNLGRLQYLRRGVNPLPFTG
jgi:hypothetical protein